MNELTASEHGDHPTFEEIFKRHHRRVYYLCLRMTGDVAEAEDLTLEVFTQVFSKLESLRGVSSFSTWLHRLTVNHILMHWRKNLMRSMIK
jgi:RNA polymerase sigma-70 factor (ECF subfamily)